MILLALLFFSCAERKEIEYSVVNGVYDASNLSKDEIVVLEGDWIFVPSHFLTPYEDFSRFKRYEHINTGWHMYEDGEDVRGYATYAVRLKNLAPNEIYAIKTSGCSSAFKAYLNGEEIFYLGKVGKTKEEEVFEWDSSIIVLPNYGLQNAVLVFHISNFNDRYPGFSKPIKFGVYSTISAQKNKDTILFVILAGYLLVAGAFFTSLYLFYSKERKALFFGLMCANFSVRICCYDEFLMTTIIPHISSIFLFKLGYATFSLAIILISLFIQELFGMTKKILLYLSFIPIFIYLLTNIFASTYISAIYLTYAQVYVLILGVYNITLVVISMVKKNKDAKLFLLGLSLFLLMAIRDILVANRVIKGQFFAHFGVLALLIPMSIIVLRSF
ncbi:MAG: 7TM diverse intracellular signaling domain-containing protein, partial [Treponema sp.]